MTPYPGPWLTRPLLQSMSAARAGGRAGFQGSFDLGRSQETVVLQADGWVWRDRHLPWPPELRERTIYVVEDENYLPLQRYAGALVKLVPTDWGPPTFEIDGIKMLPTAQVSPWLDAARKVALVAPRGKTVLDTCGGLGYFAACALAQGAHRVLSHEREESVLWLRRHNPWSPDPADPALDGRLVLRHVDITEAIGGIPDRSIDAVLHDPPRFAIAGQLYAQAFYDELARVLKPGGALFHYTGTPNAKTSGRDLPAEVMRRLERSGFACQRRLDGVYASRAGRGARSSLPR